MNFEEEPAAQRALLEEQAFVESAYTALDSETAHYAQQLADVRAQGASGTPAARSERDSFAMHYEDNLLRLRNVENTLVLGRLDYINPTQAPIHIGRITLRDAEKNIVLTDWRAPQSEPFYQATAAQPGNVRRRRHIRTRFRTVTGVEDELLTADETASETLNLTGEGALMAAMSKARDGKMGDIVATIQAEQDRVIRAPGKGILVVQGGPGTGKTAVALHRAAYLLYSERERLAGSGVLLIGPSPRFLAYIDQVLPSLGESNVVATTIAELLPGVTPTLRESREVCDIKSRLIWRTICKRSIKAVLQKPLTAPVHFTISGKRLSLTPDDVSTAQTRARQSGKRHNHARTVYATYLVDLLASRLAAALETSLRESPWIVADIAEDPDVRREVNRHWLPSSPQWLLEHLLKWPELLERIAPELSAHERSLLRRERASGYSIADIAILDELAEYLGDFSADTQRRFNRAYSQTDTPEYEQHDERYDEQLSSYVEETMAAMGLGGGIVSSSMLTQRVENYGADISLAQTAAADRTWTYGHVVVDEAQELTPMQWAMVARRNPARSMTIVGDLDQRVYGKPAGTWQEILGELSQWAHVEELTISYRTPSSILDRAARVMAALGVDVRPVHGVRDLPNCYSRTIVTADNVRETMLSTIDHECAMLTAEYGEGLGTLAIIVPKNTLNTIREWDVTLSDHRISLVTAQMAKGLEYDSVIVYEPQHIAEESLGNLYVALTRATKHLSVLSTDAVPEGL